MRKFVEIARTGVAAILLHPTRSVAVIACAVVILLPYLVGLGISKGVQEEAAGAVEWGADVYVSGQQWGRSAGVPLSLRDEIAKIEGVTSVVPRIVGSIRLGRHGEPAVLVGMPLDEVGPSISCVEGELPSGSGINELVVGTELARRLSLRVGALIPPFYRSEGGEKVSKVVGLFRSDTSWWQSRVVFTSFETAAAIFDQRGVASDLLVHCRPGYASGVASAIRREDRFGWGTEWGTIRPRVVAKADLGVFVLRGLLHREGLFNLHFVLVFVVGILVVLVTSGFGMAERRREVGILKATGWQTDEVMLRGFVESFLLSLAGASASILLAWGWLKWLNGWGIAGVFLSGVGWTPSFPVPFRLTPVPALLAFAIALAIVLSGTLYTSWRAATVPPAEAMR